MVEVWAHVRALGVHDIAPVSSVHPSVFSVMWLESQNRNQAEVMLQTFVRKCVLLIQLEHF